MSDSKPVIELDPSDFDGHTEFDKLTPEQKLEWLSNMAEFLWLAKQMRKADTE